MFFLDEPTTGIDVASARQLRQLIAVLNRAGTTIFLTTHYIEEAERLCGRIAFIVNGRIVRIDTVDNLMKPTEDRHVVLFAVDRDGGPLCRAILDAFSNLDCRALGDVAIRVESAEPVRIAPLVRLIEDRGGEVTEVRKIRPSLEDVFVRITGIGASSMLQNRPERRGMA